MASSKGIDVQKPNHLKPSPLGTKEYWEQLYDLELTTNTQNPTDEGTIWFDDSSAEEKAIAFLKHEILQKGLLGIGTDGVGVTKENCTFLDLGTGNGHFLFSLREGEEDDSEDEEEGNGGGFMGRMVGVDYSPKSVEFARRLGASKPLCHDISFEHFDILKDPPQNILLNTTKPPTKTEDSNGDTKGRRKGIENGFDIVLDKGTFDAISLSEETDEKGRRVCEGCRERVLPLVRVGGVLLVTSCNWTESELGEWFEGRREDDGGIGWFEKVGRVEYRSFRFGGQVGQTVAAVCFRRVSSGA